MYCANCGKQNVPGARFCGVCGMPLYGDTKREPFSVQPAPKKRKRKKGLFFGVAGVFIVAAVVAAALILIPGKRKEKQIAEQMNLGNRYLLEMEYEQAAVAFTKVIEVDPVNVDAYTGAAQAYAAMENYGEAVKLLEQGYENTRDEKIADEIGVVCLEAARYYMGLGDHTQAENYIETGKKYRQFEEFDRLLQEIQEQKQQTEPEPEIDEALEAAAEELPSRVNYYGADGELRYYETYIYYDNGLLCSKSLQNGKHDYNLYTVLFLYDAGGNLLEAVPSAEFTAMAFFEGNWDDSDRYEEPIEYADLSFELSCGTGSEGNTEKITFIPAEESIEQEKFGVDPARTEYLYENPLVIPTGADNEWAALYYSEIFTGEENPAVFEADCWFMNVDADTKPEIFMDYGYTYLGAKICTAGAGTADQVMFDAEAYVEYIPGENLILVSGGRMDVYYDVIYKIENGKYAVVWEGRMWRDTAEELRTGSEDMIYYYTWNEAPVATEEEYLQKIEESFDKSKAVQTDQNRYSYRQCKRLLEHLSRTDQAGGEPGGESAGLPAGNSISWEAAGLEDRSIEWGDEGLEASMRKMTGISGRDIMLSDVWEYTELKLGEGEDEPLIRDITALGSLKNLKTLEIRRSEIEDISALGNLTGLTRLHLYSTKLGDISALGNLTGLTYLHVYGGRLADVSAAGNLTGLTTLHLYSDRIEDIGVLRNLVHLQELSLNSSRISDISALRNLTALTSLTICESGVSDISVLANLRGLTYLDLNSDKISDIQALSNLTNLVELDLSGNNITDFSPLDNLTNTKIIY